MIEQHFPRVVLICDVCGAKSRPFGLRDYPVIIPKGWEMNSYPKKNGYRFSALTDSDKCRQEWEAVYCETDDPADKEDFLPGTIKRLKNGTRLNTRADSDQIPPHVADSQ